MYGRVAAAGERTPAGHTGPQESIVFRLSKDRLSALWTPAEKLQGMAFYCKLGLGFDKLREFLKRAQHEIDDPTTAATLNVMKIGRASCRERV